MPSVETIVAFLEWLEPTLVIIIRAVGFGCAVVSLIYYFLGLIEEAQYWIMLSIALFIVQQP
jgi:hypothetical protein